MTFEMSALRTYVTHLNFLTIVPGFSDSKFHIISVLACFSPFNTTVAAITFWQIRRRLTYLEPERLMLIREPYLNTFTATYRE